MVNVKTHDDEVAARTPEIEKLGFCSICGEPLCAIPNIIPILDVSITVRAAFPHLHVSIVPDLCIVGKPLEGLYCTNNVCQECCETGKCPAKQGCKAIEMGLVKLRC